jgi:hypothetical protein
MSQRRPPSDPVLVLFLLPSRPGLPGLPDLLGELGGLGHNGLPVL